MIVRFLDRDYYGDRCEKEKERDEELIKRAIPQTYDAVFPTNSDGVVRRQFRHFMMETRIVDCPLIQSMETVGMCECRRAATCG